MNEVQRKLIMMARVPVATKEREDTMSRNVKKDRAGERLAERIDFAERLRSEFGTAATLAAFIARNGAEAAAARLGLLDEEAVEEIEVRRDSAGRRLRHPRIVKRARDSKGRFVKKDRKAAPDAEESTEAKERDLFGRRRPGDEAA